MHHKSSRFMQLLNAASRANNQQFYLVNTIATFVHHIQHISTIFLGLMIGFLNEVMKLKVDRLNFVNRNLLSAELENHFTLNTTSFVPKWAKYNWLKFKCSAHFSKMLGKLYLGEWNESGHFPKFCKSKILWERKCFNWTRNILTQNKYYRINI